MTHICRALIHVRYFKKNTVGLFLTFNGTQTQPRALSTLFPDHLKHPSDRSIPNSLEFQGKKPLIRNKNFNVFKTVKLDNVFKSGFSEGAVLNFINNLSAAYELSKSTPKFESHRNTFSTENEFINFCTKLESKVHKFSIETLLLLYDLEYFNVPQTSSLMTKISKLVLDKLNNSNLYEKLLIYGMTLRKPCTESNRKSIIDQCEAYIKKSLYYDLQCKESSSSIIALFDVKGLPKHVKLILLEKLCDDIISKEISRKPAFQTIYKLACTEHDLMSKQKWLNLIRHCLSSACSSSPLLRMISLTYVALLSNDRSYYSPELIELILEKMYFINGIHIAVQIGGRLCEIGYFVKEFLDAVVSHILGESHYSVKSQSLMEILTFLAQSSFHEVVTETTAQQVVNMLKGMKIFEITSCLPNNSLYCMCLTYIGCDTRTLLSNIFERANNETEAKDSNLWTLHYLAKAYFPGEFEPLSEKTLDSLLENQFQMAGLLDPENSISKCFGSEDFILRNCVTSDRHCLHFVTVFQSDRKPINLAKYSKMSGKKMFFNVDTIDKPQGSKIIAFILFPYKQPIKFLNLPSMSGFAKMYLKSFEGVKCNIVLLHGTFFSLSLEDKKKFLKSQIDEIFEKVENK